MPIFDEDLTITQNGTESIKLVAQHANLEMGGNGRDGDIRMNDAAGNRRIYLDADNGRIEIWADNGSRVIDIGRWGNIVIGGQGQDNDGDLVLRDEQEIERIRLNAGSSPGAPIGRRIELDGRYGNIYLGGGGEDGDLRVRDSSGTDTIRLDGDSGDITLINADLAEDFELSADVTEIEPGTVMVIDEAGGLLRPSSRPYDCRVAGVISGAGSLRPGIVLGRDRNHSHRLPIALNGRVYCKVDAHPEPIRVGDLLTTSAVSGHAMRAANPMQAFGAVIGKALEPFDGGRGLIPILVALQ